VIGLLRDNGGEELATVTMLKEHIEYRVRENQYMRELGIKSTWLYKKEWSLRDYADWRKSTNLSRFNYCPECGKVIDWGAIRKEEPV
jgi:hypothetical protein